jgi:glutathione S-transferase
MIKLFVFGKKFGLVDPSPFVSKVHAFLKIAGLEYKVIASPKNLGKAPKGKLPFIIDGETAIGDSQDIIEYLKKKYKLDMDSHLNAEQKASAYLYTKSLDENLYWCMVWSRWQHEATWQIVKPMFFKGIPFPLSYVVPKIIRKKVIKSINAQGTGRHSEQEIIEIARKTFAALSDILADKTYFFGDKVSTFDATAYAFISSFTQADLDNDINTMTKTFKNLVAFADRFKQQYFT